MVETAGQPAWAIRSTGSGCAQLDAPGGQILRVSSSVCRLLGYTERELLGTKLLDLALAEDRAGSLAAWRTLLEGGGDELTFGVRCRRKDGGIRSLQVTGVIVGDARDRPQRVALFIEDITEQRRAEERALAAEQALAESEALLRMTGGAVHPALLRVAPIRDERGEITPGAGLYLDIGRLDRTEEALRESERRLRAALDEARRVLAERERLEDELRRRERQLASLMANSPDAIYRMDLDLRCTFMSPTSLAVTGLPPEHYVGRTPRDNGLPLEVCEAGEAACREAQRTGKPQRMEFSLGARRFRARYIPELGPDGAVESFLGITEDVTAERLAEEQRQKLLESERAARDE
ncbi:MAG TPA: PAS domain S-box protein, partial [Sorangium sp.]|nr:PAS domain S-box protein [Sorangium sp.]